MQFPSSVRRTLSVLLLLSTSTLINGQSRAFHPDSINRAWLIEVGGAIAFPGADLAERFGLSGLAGVGGAWKNSHNWLFRLDGQFLFGSNVKEDTILQSITTDSGFVIGLDGLLHEPIVYERGFVVSAGIDKIIPVAKRYPNSGIILGMRATFLQHKIFYSLRPDENFPHLNKQLRRGYDRLSNGFGLTEVVGWHHMSRSGLINFRLALESIQALTKNRRPYNFDAMQPDAKRRLDVLFNLKLTWMLPIWVYPKGATIIYE